MTDKIKKVKTALLSMQRHSWEQGVSMQAFWELGDNDIAFAHAIEAAYRKTDDGRLATIGFMDAATDPCSVGEVLWHFSSSYEDFKNPCLGLLDWALNKAPRNSKGIVYHMADSTQFSKQFWVDSIYMLPPFLAAAGHSAEAVAQIDGYWNALYDTEKGLLSHMWDDEQKTFVRKDFWGTGNGWAMAGLCRVIDLLPESMGKERDRLIAMNSKLISTVAKYIRSDGLAHDVLDDTNTFVDAALPMLFAYSVYRGIRSGWLDNTFLELANKCRLKACDKVDQYGFIRDVCGAPHFNKPGISPEAQAFFLLMHAAYQHIGK